MQYLTITRPDDWHLHLRDGPALAAVISATTRCFARAVIMPNLKPPIITVAQALAYRQRILAVLATTDAFQPLMTLYLTDNTSVAEISRIKDSEGVIAVKYYPQGATTHSDNGVTNWQHVYSVLEALQQHDIPLLIHGEVTDADFFDREAIFIERELAPLVKHFPALRIVLEHITTREAVQYIQSSSPNIAATITAHHLSMNRNALFEGGLHPHHYCLPILKREQHRQALLQAATSGHPRFFLGTDSAPHPQTAKETACGCAGMYTAPLAIELYAEIFEQAQALDKLEAFASFYGADFYQLPRNTDTITLEKRTWHLPTSFQLGDSQVIPLRAGEAITWQQHHDQHDSITD
jgi:dihydroorotase